MDKLSLAFVSPDELRPYEKNAKTHPPEQLAQIAASIEEFGFTSPILVGPDNVVIAGHGRLQAAKNIGLTEVPIIRLAHLSEAQRRALVIADNRIAENGGWDEDLLREELAGLKASEIDLDLLAFSDDELEALLSGTEPQEAPPGDPAHVPELEETPVSQPGDIWVLGDHRLVCGDATDAGALLSLLDGEAVDLVWTDPPYNVNYEGSAGKIKNDNLGAGEFGDLLHGAFTAAFAVMREGAPIYVAHADTEGQAFRSAFSEAGFKLAGCLVWVKPSLVLGRSDYQWRHEPILYGWKPGAAHTWFGGRAQTTVFEDETAPVRVQEDGTLHIDVGDETLVIEGEGISIRSVAGSIIRHEKPARNGEHPTMKPVGLVQRMLENSCAPGGVVLDPFSGSGSTLIACEMTGRRGRAVELDPRFCDVIVRRWQELTGSDATLAAGGATFAEIEAAPARAA